MAGFVLIVNSVDPQVIAKRRGRWIGSVLGVMLAANAASAMGISPVLVELSRRYRVASVTLTNPSVLPKTYQVETLSWRQHEAADQYAESRDLLVSPPIAGIPARQSI